MYARGAGERYDQGRSFDPPRGRRGDSGIRFVCLDLKSLREKKVFFCLNCISVEALAPSPGHGRLARNHQWPPGQPPAMARANAAPTRSERAWLPSRATVANLKPKFAMAAMRMVRQQKAEAERDGQLDERAIHV